jgi:hypothetical protein
LDDTEDTSEPILIEAGILNLWTDVLLGCVD